MKKQMKFEVQLNVTVTEEDIDDIMVSVLEGGINYWCRKAEVVGPYLGEAASEQISRGGSLILHDIETSAKWELTLKKFLNGLGLYLKTDGSSITKNGLDTALIDGLAADSIVQLGIFGEIEFA